MCGIAGLCNFSEATVDTGLLLRMASCMRHRGPDDEGYAFINTRDGVFKTSGGKDTPAAVRESRYLYSPVSEIDSVDAHSGNFNLAFGHRRLSIIDLSPAGHQPMCNRDGKCWIVYNGEIYNYVELREELKSRGHNFMTQSDTEVILQAYEEWGFDCLNKFNGMWAFALWDCRSRKLFCARDRFGVKPFYYYADIRLFTFASEIKALLQHPAVTRQVNEEVVYNYLMWGFLGYSADTFFKDVRQLEPGHYLVVDVAGDIAVKKWWRIDVNADIGDVSDTGARENADKLAALLEDSIRLRLRSDVPIGTCLSGGLDSSSIVCLANRLMFDDASASSLVAGDRQKTFSSCHHDARIDERKFIEEVIQRTNAEKNYVFPDGEIMWQDLPSLVRHQDEPFGGTSIYAQWCVMQKVRQRGVKVLLDGQGGDELLAGYHPYYGTFLINLLLAGKLAQSFKEAGKIAAITGWPRMTASAAMSAAVSVYNFLPAPLQIAGRRLNSSLQGTQMHKLVQKDFDKKYFGGSMAHFKGLTGDYCNLQKRLATDVSTELAVLLRYEDRNSMAFSVEARVPFLDYRLVEFAFSLPSAYKIHDGWTKWILREAMKCVLPEDIRWRQDKLGFPTPQQHWLSQNKSNIRGLFSHRDCMCSGYINTTRIGGDLDALLQSDASAAAFWRIINLELWMKAFFS